MMNLLGREIRCPEPDDLKNLALSFAEALKGGEVCLMYGEVGAGKTFFTTALVEALGGDSRMVASPSFTLVNEYDLVKGRVLHHRICFAPAPIAFRVAFPIIPGSVPLGAFVSSLVAPSIVTHLTQACRLARKRSGQRC